MSMIVEPRKGMPTGRDPVNRVGGVDGLAVGTPPRLLVAGEAVAGRGGGGKGGG